MSCLVYALTVCGPFVSTDRSVICTEAHRCGGMRRKAVCPAKRQRPQLRSWRLRKRGSWQKMQIKYR